VAVKAFKIHSSAKVPRSPLWYADKADLVSEIPVALIVTGDHASIVDAGRVGLLALGRIEGRDGSIRIAYETVLDPAASV
jgi:hypothetical protein